MANMASKFPATEQNGVTAGGYFIRFIRPKRSSEGRPIRGREQGTEVHRGHRSKPSQQPRRRVIHPLKAGQQEEGKLARKDDALPLQPIVLEAGLFEGTRRNKSERAVGRVRNKGLSFLTTHSPM